MPWAVSGLHPTALYEHAGLLLLACVVARADPRWTTPLVLGGFGALRLALEPLRAEPPLGSPVVPAGVLALLWLAGALVLARSRTDRNLNTPQFQGVTH